MQVQHGFPLHPFGESRGRGWSKLLLSISAEVLSRTGGSEYRPEIEAYVGRKGAARDLQVLTYLAYRTAAAGG